MSRRTTRRDPIRLLILSLAVLVVVSGCASLGDLFNWQKAPDATTAEALPNPPTNTATGEEIPAEPKETTSDGPSDQRLAALRPEVPAVKTKPESASLTPTEMMEAYWQAVARTTEKQQAAKEVDNQPPAIPTTTTSEPTPAPQPTAPAAPRASGAVMPVITDIRGDHDETPPAPAPALPIHQVISVEPPTPTAPSVKPPVAIVKPAAPVGFNLKRTISLLEKQLAAAEKPDPGSQRLLRLLHMANGDEIQALKDIEALPQQEKEAWSQLMWLASNLWGINNRLTPEGRAAESLVALEELQRSLRRAAGLQIRSLKLCTRVVGYGVYDEMPEPTFAAGRSSKVIVYVEVENFVSRLQDDKQYHTKLQLRLQLFAKGGAAPLWEKAYTNIEDASFNHRRDLYVPVLITLDKQRAGEYVLKVAVDDVHAGKTDERKAPIRFR